MDFADFRPLVQTALREDLGEDGDITSSAVFSDQQSRLALYSKGMGVLAGAEMYCLVYREVDPAASVEFTAEDGDSLETGRQIASVHGRADSILRAERVALNFLSFLSGIATMTRDYVAAASKRGPAQILDTRKTLPGYRALSKYAVRVGGGKNHRMGLYDMVLLKDNHIDICGSVTAAVEAARSKWGEQYDIEVECRNLSEVREGLGAGADIIMLDNMDLATIADAVSLVDHRAKLEVSGNVSIDVVGDLAATGVDFISVGKLTHSVTGFDFSLRSESAGNE